MSKRRERIKRLPEGVISHDKVVSLALIQENAERSERERRKQAAALLRAIRAGAKIEPGKLTFDPRTKRVVAAS